MEREKRIFSQIEKIVRQKENYLPRNYQTVGGRWTVDTYQKGDITLQISDEGWTSRILSSTVDVVDSGGFLTMNKGAVEDLQHLLESLEGRVGNSEAPSKEPKSYTLQELTEIGRKEFNLGESWHCFMADATEYPWLRYGLSPKNDKGEYERKEVYGYINLTD